MPFDSLSEMVVGLLRPETFNSAAKRSKMIGEPESFHREMSIATKDSPSLSQIDPTPKGVIEDILRISLFLIVITTILELLRSSFGRRFYRK